MKTIKRAFLAGLGSMTLMAFAPNAAAQFIPGSGGNTTIFADDAVSEGNRTTLVGGVDVRQGDTRVLADRMVITTTGANGLQNSDFSRVEAIGNFYFMNPDQEVRGDKGVYTRETETFVVSGDVIFKQPDGNVVTGSTMYYNLKDQSARVVGTCKGRKCGSQGRVNILIKNTDSQATRG